MEIKKIALILVVIFVVIIVIGLFSYCFFALNGCSESGMQGNPVKALCEAKEYTYCTKWSAVGYNQNNTEFRNYAPDCANFTWAQSVLESDCRTLLNSK